MDLDGIRHHRAPDGSAPPGSVEGGSSSDSEMGEPVGRSQTYGGSARPKASVAIIGAGIGGIATAVRLKRAGIEAFTIFEQSAGPGGTWWDNTYPGAECDIPIAFYSYSFMPHDWIRTHASQGEIQKYLQLVIDKFGLGPHLRFNTRVEEVVWSETTHCYTVRTATEAMEFRAVVTAVGLLNVPRYPTWPGLERFQGAKFHTARWEHEHDLDGKRIAVVGNGSTAAQVVPAIAPKVGLVKMFSREPAYVMPKQDRPLTPIERRRNGSAWRRRWERLKLLGTTEQTVTWRTPGSRAQREKRRVYREYVDTVFSDRPDLRAAVIPDYPFACKRIVGSSDLYPALKRGNVELVSRAVVAVTRDGVIDSAGEEHKVDVLVMATGFQPWHFLSTIKVTGRGGRSLHGVWGEEPEAYLGIQVPGFPNFFMMYGPNTNYFCITFMLEQQAKYIGDCISRIDPAGNSAVEVRPSLMSAWNRRLAKSLSGKVLEANCSNYYHTSTGRNVVTYPWLGSFYWLMCRLSRLSTFRYRPLGAGRQHLDQSRKIHRDREAQAEPV